MKYLAAIQKILKTKESFDIIERHIYIGGKNTYMYYIDGFIKDDVMQRIMDSFFNITPETMNSYKNALSFINNEISYVEVAEDTNIDSIVTAVLSGQTAMIIDGYDSVIMIDLRTYPVRGPQEPEKEQVLRGARDGFVETIVFNTALIRRRIRSPELIFEMVNVGEVSKTDIAIGYLGNKVDKCMLSTIKEKLSSIDIAALTVGDQSLVESFGKTHWLNPFPRVRYTERPDVASAHVVEGKIVILVDNTPTAMILPTSVFDFMQDVDDYYFPVITGNYLRFVRNIIVLATLLLTPLYLIVVDGKLPLPRFLDFLLPQEAFPVPLLIQFLILEFAIDGLKLASLNTPSSLGMSLSVIGGLILGDFAIKTGWFIPQSILYMSIVALASFTQPSIEFGYAIKFFRIILLLLSSWFGIWGLLGGIVFNIIVLGCTKTLTGSSYLYPLIPFNWKALKNQLFRTRLYDKRSKKN